MGGVAPDLNVKASRNIQGVCKINDVFYQRAKEKILFKNCFLEKRDFMRSKIEFMREKNILFVKWEQLLKILDKKMAKMCDNNTIRNKIKFLQ